VVGGGRPVLTPAGYEALVRRVMEARGVPVPVMVPVLPQRKPSRQRIRTQRSNKRE
jgi:hypothetical protein